MIARDLGIDDRATSAERRLDVACALVHALLAPLASDRPAERAEALALLEELRLPAAVFDAGPSPRLANHAWRGLLDDRGGGFPRAHVDDVLRTGAGAHLAALALDGCSARCAATLRPILDRAGATTGVIVLCTLLAEEVVAREPAASAVVHAEADRAELLARARAARADAEEANRLKDRFLAVVSHELRAPLTTMMLWADILRDERADAALRAQALDAIHRSARSQSRLVDDLLDLSRGISGKLHVDLHPLDLERLLREALEAIAPAAVGRQIAIARRGTPILAEIQGDGVRLRQVLDNLLANAVRFTQPGGRITVAVAREDRSIAIDIEDSGCGIAPQALARLFEPFSEPDDATMRVNGGLGLGLGLAIAKQLVALHDGELTAASAGPGRGAIFTLRLPVAPARLGGSPTGALVRRPTLDRVRVLVIDDDLRVRDALALLLGRAGAVVETAESAESARARIARHVPEALVCDIALPGEDGNSFIRRLRASGASEQDIPAIAVTACAMKADVERALAAGFDLHIAKPVDFERLVEKIGELVAARRRTRTIAGDGHRTS